MRIGYLLTALLLAPGFLVASPAGEEAFLGRWDLTVSAKDGAYPSWLELTCDGGKLKARFVDRGSVFPVPDVTIENGELKFQFTRDNPPATSVYRARLVKGRLEGTVLGGGGEVPIPLTGSRAPAWPKTAPKRKPGKPVALFNGKDLSGWLPQNPGQPLNWTVKDGALSNEAKAANIYSQKKFSDFKLEIELKVAEHGNSGIYLRGRHEIQVLDDLGRPPSSHGNGGIYGFLTPRVNASRPAGQWQTVEATLVRNRVTVVLNGTTIIEDEEIPGITGGALDSNEGAPGPILLQGDHGPVQYRKVVVTPLK